MTFIALYHLLRPLLSLASVQIMLYPDLHYLSCIVLVSLCVSFLWLLHVHVVHCVEFGQLAFLLLVQQIRIFVWMTLSSRTALILNDCRMPSFLILCSLQILAIFRSQLISAVSILLSSCFRIVQHSNPNKKIGCIIVSYSFLSWLLLLMLCFSISCSSIQIVVQCMQFSLVGLCHWCNMHALSALERRTEMLHNRVFKTLSVFKCTSYINVDIHSYKSSDNLWPTSRPHSCWITRIKSNLIMTYMN